MKSWRLALALVVLVLVPAAFVVVLTIRRDRARAREVSARAELEDRGPVVLVTTVETTPADRDLVLPADARALYQTSLYAKLAGFVQSIRVDKGDRVAKGELIGTIESPETDQALAAARADLVLRTDAERRARALAPDLLPQQELEAAIANLHEAQANLAHALSTKQYEEIRAPFDGVITARYVDPGALLPAATGSTIGALPFVDVADPRTMRVQVFVGADAASFVKEGDAIAIWEDAHPERTIDATVTRTAGAIDPRTRTMLVESEIDNRVYGVLPGAFVHERLRIRTPPLPTVPAEAVFVRGGKTLVATIDRGRAHLVVITPGVSDGRVVQVLTGLRGGETVAINVPSDVEDGARVQARPSPARAIGTTARRPPQVP